jgi:molybdopterin-containing oxidoreductase family iron-sulfur binding subunit
MNDPASQVSQYRKHNLGYHVLEDVNARPNVTYMARLRNVDETTGKG